MGDAGGAVLRKAGEQSAVGLLERGDEAEGGCAKQETSGSELEAARDAPREEAQGILAQQQKLGEEQGLHGRLRRTLSRLLARLDAGRPVLFSCEREFLVVGGL